MGVMEPTQRRAIDVYPPPTRPANRPARPTPGGDYGLRYERLLNRAARRPPWVVVVSIFFGLGWLRAAVSKSIDGNWWSGAEIDSFVADHADVTVGWFQPILNGLVVMPAPMLALVVVCIQVSVAACLLTNRRIIPALLVATVLNVVFVAVGAVNPSAFYLVGQGALLLWAMTDGRGVRRQTIMFISIGAALFAVLNVPFITTLHPEKVIDDPAIMLATLAGLAALGAQLASRTMVVVGRRSTLV